jgi:hypothetical protein
MGEDVAMMWQKASIHRGGRLVGKHFIPFGKSGDMGGEVTTKIIHQQNVMLKSTKQGVLKNLNHIDTVIEMEIADMANFGNSGMFTLHEAFLSYTGPSGVPIFTSIEATQTGGSYRILFDEKNGDLVDNILTDADDNIDAISNWSDSPVHYRCIILDDVEVAQHKEQGQGKSF